MITAEVLLWLHELEYRTFAPKDPNELPIHLYVAGSEERRKEDSMLHGWLGGFLARLGCALVAWGSGLQERYYRYLPARDFDGYLSGELDRIITKSESQYQQSQSGWIVLSE